MKVINFGSTFELYPDDLKTFDQLPVGTYKVRFNPMAGYSLALTHDYIAIEGKTYGNHEERIEKTLRAYDAMSRSLGVILSGDKGMGKSLFTQILAVKAIERGIPVIIVSESYPMLADFLDKIEQEVLIIFDEFEKIFPKQRSNDGNKNQTTQDDLLGLFDGTSQFKRIYAVTVNDLHKVNDYMMNRTGRFHYHIRFDYPTADEIEIYLADKVEEQYHNEIKHVVAFATRVKINYDSLRSIAFELNMGYPFKSAIRDLNILTTSAQHYDYEILLTNGKKVTDRNERLNLFDESIRLTGYTPASDYFSLTFEPKHLVTHDDVLIISGEHVQFELDTDEGTPEEDKNVKVQAIQIRKKIDRGVNYNLTV